MKRLFVTGYLFASLFKSAHADLKQSLRGKELYSIHCAECHGDLGQGVENEYAKPLVGNWPLEKLVRYIDGTMPDFDPDLVVGKEAEQVSSFIYESFYKKPERFKKESKIQLAHLTNRQFKQSLADIFSEFEGRPLVNTKENGLRAKYYEAEGTNERKRKVTERVDRRIVHDFGNRAPVKGMEADKFSIYWEGSIIPRESGWYEFFVRSPNGFVLRVNQPRGLATLEEKVSPGMIREVSAKIFLLGGRAYPISLDFFKFNDPQASIELMWKTPIGEKEYIPIEFLFTQFVPASFVSQKKLPPDDFSHGFERGIQVDESWDEALTFAVLEAANHAGEKINGLTKSNEDAETRRKVIQIAEEFLRLAFRKKPSHETMKFFVYSNFDSQTPLQTSIEKVVLLTLKSPRFLYPEWQWLTRKKNDSLVVANRLALYLWDSVPDKKLNHMVDRGQLVKEWQVQGQAKRMLSDSRSKAKFNHFLIHWLEMNTKELPIKSRKVHPEFSPSLLTDLRHSILSSVEKTVWENKGTFKDLLRMPTFKYNHKIAQFYDLTFPVDREKSEFISADSRGLGRHGLHTHPYLLANFSYSEESSPIHRGVFVSRKILGRNLRPPKEAISFSDSDFDPDWSMRQKVTSITKPANCMSCHDVINSTGFSLEGFDATGRTRLKIGDHPIDLKVNFLDRDGIARELNGPDDLLEQALNSPQSAKSFVYELARYVSKQSPESYSNLDLLNLSEMLGRGEINLKELYLQLCLRAACDGFEFQP